MSECRNCFDVGWVCENHQDMSWGDRGCECGAGAPCPVCNRHMACAPYIPQWEFLPKSPEKLPRQILVCGGWIMDETETFRQWRPAERTYMVDVVDYSHFDKDGVQCRFRGENAGAHDEYYWHMPVHWMPVPEPKDKPQE